MSAALRDMRGLLQTGALIEELTDDLLSQVLKHSPDANGRLALVSHGVRRRLAAVQPKPPLWFHVLLDQYPQATDAQRRESMLSALEAQAPRFRLLSIEMPGFDLDEDPATAVNALAPLRGAVRLAAVLQRHGAALESLDLSLTGISAWREIRNALRSCVSLQRVNLSGETITAGNHPFTWMTECRATLRELVLEDNDIGRVTTQLAPVLRECRALTKLSLSGNRLDYVDMGLGGQPPVLAMQRLTDALRQHPSLAHLDLTACTLSAGCITLLVAVLPTCPRLERLGLAQNHLTARRAAWLGAMVVLCPAMRHLDVRENPELFNGGLRALVASRGLRGLASLDVSHCHIDCIGPAGDPTGPQVPFLEELALCPRMQRLNLSHNNLGDTFVRALARMLEACPALERLELASTLMTDTGVAALALAVPRCPGLTRLNITRNACKPATGMQMQAAWRATHGDMGGLWMD
jgi:Leucine-rich repeat (LRR) protein